MVAVGVDARKKGWIAVALRTGTDVQAHFLESIEDLGEAIPDAEVVGIDIPIGLPDTGRRAADIEAKTALGPRSNSVFFTPVRAALEAVTLRQFQPYARDHFALCNQVHLRHVPEPSPLGRPANPAHLLASAPEP